MVHVCLLVISIIQYVSSGVFTLLVLNVTVCLLRHCEQEFLFTALNVTHSTSVFYPATSYVLPQPPSLAVFLFLYYPCSPSQTCACS